MATNTAPNKNGKTTAGAYDDWEEESTGFPPYWEPEVGAVFVGTVVDLDDSDPDFRRYIVQAGEPLACFRGPKDDQQPVTLQAGEHFTVGDYYNLPLYKYAGIKLHVTATDKVKTKGGKSTWLFKVKMSPADKAKLLAESGQTTGGRRQLPPSRYSRDNAGEFPGDNA